MGSSPVIVLEVFFAFGVPIVWGLWQLLALRRERARDDAAARAEVARDDPAARPTRADGHR